MKPLPVLAVFITLSVSSFFSCSKNELNVDVQLQERDGIFYAVNQDEPYNGKVITTDKNGQHLKEQHFKDGKFHGLSLAYYANGQKKEEGRYQIGKKDSLWVCWSDSGQILKERHYKDGKLNGGWVSWYPNGQKEKEGLYEDGKQTGFWSFWLQDGTALDVIEDIDGNDYPIIKIGEQTWMAANLKATHYRNGDAIPNVTRDSDWQKPTTGAYCTYNNDEENAIVYGHLYNWDVINDKRAIAPEGWHIPSDQEWKDLEMHLGMSQADSDEKEWRGENEGEKMKKDRTTSIKNEEEIATNESGFSALLGGCRAFDGHFNDMGSNAYFWTASDTDAHAFARILYHGSPQISRTLYNKPFGFSIRCVRD